jgi:hypothetical protein
LLRGGGASYGGLRLGGAVGGPDGRLPKLEDEEGGRKEKERRRQGQLGGYRRRRRMGRGGTIPL